MNGPKRIAIPLNPLPNRGPPSALSGEPVIRSSWPSPSRSATLQRAHGLARPQPDERRRRDGGRLRIEEGGPAESHVETTGPGGAPDQGVGDAVAVDVAGGEGGSVALPGDAPPQHGRVAQIGRLAVGEDRPGQPVEGAAAVAGRAQQEIVVAVRVEVGGDHRAQAAAVGDAVDDGGRPGDESQGLSAAGRREGGQRDEQGERGGRAGEGLRHLSAGSPGCWGVRVAGVYPRISATAAGPMRAGTASTARAGRSRRRRYRRLRARSRSTPRPARAGGCQTASRR